VRCTPLPAALPAQRRTAAVTPAALPAQRRIAAVTPPLAWLRAWIVWGSGQSLVPTEDRGPLRAWAVVMHVRTVLRAQVGLPASGSTPAAKVRRLLGGWPSWN
jgi:hypothetical protein